MGAIAELAITVTTTPWALTRTMHDHARTAGLTDEDVLHVVALSAYFGHLNRIADAVAVPLDYTVEHPPPATDPTVAPFAPAPDLRAGAPAIALTARPATAAALTAWRDYVFERDAPLTRAQRTAIAGSVARWLGDGAGANAASAPPEAALHELAEVITLAPWRLADRSFAPLRQAGFDDAALFDACVVASTAGVVSRITVALGALDREPPAVAF